MQLNILVTCTLIHWLAIYASRPYISLLIKEITDNNATPGMIAAIYGLIQVCLALQVSDSINKFGAKKLIVFGNILLVSSFVVLATTKSLFLIALSSLSLGIAHVFVMISAQYTATGFSGSVSKEKAVGLYTFSNSLGIFMGPSVGAFFYEKLGVGRNFWGIFFISLLSLIVAFFIKDNRKAVSTNTSDAVISAIELMKDKKIFSALIVSSMVMFTSEIAITYFPIYGLEIGLSVQQIGIILSTSGLSMTLIRPFLGKLSTYFPLSKIVASSLLIGGIAMMFYGFVTMFGFLLIVAAICGLAQGLLGPATMLSVTNAAKQAYRGKVLALRTMIVFFSQSIGPVICGLLSSYTGIAPVFILGGSIMSFCSKIAYQSGE